MSSTTYTSSSPGIGLDDLVIGLGSTAVKGAVAVFRAWQLENQRALDELHARARELEAAREARSRSQKEELAQLRMLLRPVEMPAPEAATAPRRGQRDDQSWTNETASMGPRAQTATRHAPATAPDHARLVRDRTREVVEALQHPIFASGEGAKQRAALVAQVQSCESLIETAGAAFAAQKLESIGRSLAAIVHQLHVSEAELERRRDSEVLALAEAAARIRAIVSRAVEPAMLARAHRLEAELGEAGAASPGDDRTMKIGDVTRETRALFEELDRSSEQHLRRDVVVAHVTEALTSLGYVTNQVDDGAGPPDARVIQLDPGVGVEIGVAWDGTVTTELVSTGGASSAESARYENRACDVADELIACLEKRTGGALLEERRRRLQPGERLRGVHVAPGKSPHPSMTEVRGAAPARKR